MGFLKRAIKNTTRRLTKSMLLLLTFFVIGNFVIIGLGVSNASDSAQDLTRQKMRAIVTYEIDYDLLYEYTETLDEEALEEFYNDEGSYRLDREFLADVVTDERVKAYNMGSTTMMYESDFLAVPIGNEREENDSMGMCGMSDTDGNYFEYPCGEPAFKVRQEMTPNLIDFADNIYTLVDGEMYTQEDMDNYAPVCLITDTLAEYNNISVGDTITIYTNDPVMFDYGELDSYYGSTKENSVREVEVIGIFDNSETIDPNADNFDWMSKYESPENIILMPYTAAVEADFETQLAMWESYKERYPDEEYYQDPENTPTLEDFVPYVRSATLLLNDPLDVEDFVEEYQLVEERSYMVFDANNDTFKTLSKPLETMSLFANFIVLLVLINAIVIITLITALTLKTREYEIGVLLSMGVSKAKIVAQFFVELALVAILGFSLAVISGSLIAKQVGDKVLSYQIEVSDVDEEDNEMDYYYWGKTNYFTEITLEDMISEYEVSISPWIIGQIYVAGLGIVFISILIPSMMIMRFNPKRILMNTN